MAKKYLSFDEAAQLLGIDPSELTRLREKGDLRGFADRGTWKFKADDVEELGRRRQADSDPDVPLQSGEGGEGSVLGGGTEDDDVGEQPTVIRKRDDDSRLGSLDGPSDSDVRLILDDSLSGDPDSDPEVALPPSLADSDSDVRLADDNDPQIDRGSDSDVKLVATDSESDVKLVSSDPGSDSDVRLFSAAEAEQKAREGESSSDVRAFSEADMPTDSDVSLVSIDEDSDASVFGDDDEMADESGMTLKAESGISLENLADSGISLESVDSGIALEGDDDSGFVLDSGESGIALDSAGESGIALSSDSEVDSDMYTLSSDSGIALDSPADSGIALDNDLTGADDDELYQTVPMLDIDGGDDDANDTNLEVPTLDGDSEYELSMETDDSDADTSVILFDDDDEADDHSATVVQGGRSASLDEDFDGSGEFDLEDSEQDIDAVAAYDDDDLDVADDILGEDDAIDDLDVFDAADEDFDESFESGESHAEFVAPMPAGRMAAPEADWGVGTFVGLIASTGLMAVCGLLMIDLVSSMWAYNEPATYNSALLEMIGGLF